MCPTRTWTRRAACSRASPESRCATPVPARCQRGPTTSSACCMAAIGARSRTNSMRWARAPGSPGMRMRGSSRARRSSRAAPAISLRRHSMDDLDRAIVDRLQSGFPVCERPFLEAARALGTTEDELIARIDRLLRDETLTRFGPLFQVERMGGTFTLAAMSVPEARFDATVAAVNALPEVAHNY